MLTQKIDAALYAIENCRLRIPDLAEAYRPGSPERAAIEELVAAVAKVDATLYRRDAKPPQVGR